MNVQEIGIGSGTRDFGRVRHGMMSRTSAPAVRTSPWRVSPVCTSSRAAAAKLCTLGLPRPVWSRRARSERRGGRVYDALLGASPGVVRSARGDVRRHCPGEAAEVLDTVMANPPDRGHKPRVAGSLGRAVVGTWMLAFTSMTTWSAPPADSYVPRGFARRVGSATEGSSGQ